jgi:N-acetylglucosaminyldiphosphoundecaprenol N-acetyl-beta-D-mannosaminyltransferase
MASRRFVSHGDPPAAGAAVTRSSVTLLGVEIDNVTLDEAAVRVVELGARRESHLVVTTNVDHVVLLRRDQEFRNAYDVASIRVADGAPIVLLSRLIGMRLVARVTGSDLLPRITACGAGTGLRIFLLGGEPDVASLAVTRLRESAPGAILGHYSPPMAFENAAAENHAALRAVRAFEPHVLFVCLGAPRAEKWAAAHLHQLPGCVAVCAGAAVDFAAGSKRRAPTVVQRMGLEWAFRLVLEPRRLWRRYLLRDSRFAALAARELWRHHRRRWAAP